jgi:hypothetical protein
MQMWLPHNSYDAFVTAWMLTLSFITEKCLQNSATFGTGWNPYCSGYRAGYLTDWFNTIFAQEILTLPTFFR